MKERIDMKTIEERAEEFATKRVGGKYLNPNTSQGTSWLSLNLTYKQIAKEQEAITKKETIIKVHHVLEKVLAKEMLDELIKVLEEE